MNTPEIVAVENNLVAWGGPVSLLPDYEDIPATFREIAAFLIDGKQGVMPSGRGYARAAKWVVAAEKLGKLRVKEVSYTPKEGVDAEAALRHFHAATRARGTTGLHRLAGGAYLLSKWFKDVEYEDR